MDILLEGESHTDCGHDPRPSTRAGAPTIRRRWRNTRNPLMPMRAQRSGGGRTGHETRSNSTIASCINPTLPTMLVVLMHVCMYTRTPWVHVSIRKPPPPTQNTQPRDFGGPESCQRSLDKDYPSSAANFDESMRVALDPPPPKKKMAKILSPAISKARRVVKEV